MVVDQLVGHFDDVPLALILSQRREVLQQDHTCKWHYPGQDYPTNKNHAPPPLHR